MECAPPPLFPPPFLLRPTRAIAVGLLFLFCLRVRGGGKKSMVLCRRRDAVTYLFFPFRRCNSSKGPKQKEKKKKEQYLHYRLQTFAHLYSSRFRNCMSLGGSGQCNLSILQPFCRSRVHRYKAQKPIRHTKKGRRGGGESAPVEKYIIFF